MAKQKSAPETIIPDVIAVGDYITFMIALSNMQQIGSTTEWKSLRISNPVPV